MEIVINTCYGGFSLSKRAMKFLGVSNPYVYESDRTNAMLIEAVVTLGRKADGLHAHLEVVEIPDGSFWEIREHAGIESVCYSATELRYANGK